MRASDCPASNCSIKSLMLAAMSSCLVRGFLLSMVVMLFVVAALLMVLSPLAVAVAFHAMRGMYLHAERLLAKAGRQGARGGVSPIRSKAEDERSEGLHKRSAEDCWETPCAAPGQRPQRGLVSLFACIKHAGIVRVALRQEQAAVVGGGRRASGWRQVRSVAPPYEHSKAIVSK